MSDRTRELALRRKYGITLAERDRLIAAQGNVCAFCRRPFLSRKVVVDHDHTTGRIRGVVHNRCNLAIGSFTVELVRADVRETANSRRRRAYFGLA